jgi:hypothetical protein
MEITRLNFGNKYHTRSRRRRLLKQEVICSSDSTNSQETSSGVTTLKKGISSSQNVKKVINVKNGIINRKHACTSDSKSLKRFNYNVVDCEEVIHTVVTCPNVGGLLDASCEQ